MAPPETDLQDVGGGGVAERDGLLRGLDLLQPRVPPGRRGEEHGPVRQRLRRPEQPLVPQGHAGVADEEHRREHADFEARRERARRGAAVGGEGEERDVRAAPGPGHGPEGVVEGGLLDHRLGPGGVPGLGLAHRPGLALVGRLHEGDEEVVRAGPELVLQLVARAHGDHPGRPRVRAHAQRGGRGAAPRDQRGRGHRRPEGQGAQAPDHGQRRGRGAGGAGHGGRAGLRRGGRGLAIPHPRDPPRAGGGAGRELGGRRADPRREGGGVQRRGPGRWEPHGRDEPQGHACGGEEEGFEAAAGCCWGMGGRRGIDGPVGRGCSMHHRGTPEGCCKR